MFDTNGYLGFTFAGRHSSEFGLLVVSDGSRYHQTFYNQFSDSVVSVPGKAGGYYFGTQFSQRDFDINCVFDNITSHTVQKIQKWLYPNVVGWLIFDEQPYKRYLVKLSTVPSFNFIPFDEFKTGGGYSFQKEILKGELNLSFFMLEEYGKYNPEYELPRITKDSLVPQQALDSGIIPSNYVRKNIFLPYEHIIPYEQIEDMWPKDSIFSLYNAGNGTAEADFYFIVEKNSFPLEILNYNDGTIYKITNPSEIIKRKYNDEIFNNTIKYRIQILAKVKEVWLICLDNKNNQIENTEKINIGACYNQFYPKVYHLKPTETCIFSQSINYVGSPEPLFYTYSYDNEDIGSSDSKQRQYTFEEFQKYWNDYTILSEYNTFNVNNIVSPAVIFVDYPEDYDFVKNKEQILYNALCYLIYPNKYSCNQNLYNLIVEYDHSYI